MYISLHKGCNQKRGLVVRRGARKKIAAASRVYQALQFFFFLSVFVTVFFVGLSEPDLDYVTL